MKIFVVDDERVIAVTLAAILNQQGFNAVSFTNPVEALERSKTEEPDLLLSDVVMPQLTGIELAIRLREIRPKCKVLLFSGQATTASLLDEAMQQGHEFHILAKPVHPTELLAVIKDISSSKSDGEPASTSQN